MQPAQREILARVGREIGTPCFVYCADEIDARLATLERVFAGRFRVSYAVKANPNARLLGWLGGRVATLDCSSAGEIDRALAAGFAPGELTFSGPAKRAFELERAVAVGCGEIVCESERELEQLEALSARAGRRTVVFPRINPLRGPRKFGVHMAGRASQFGIDEETLDPILDRLSEWPHLEFGGFHVYSGTNCLDADAVCENFEIFLELFARFSASHALRPRKLIFGSGFGIPYHDGEQPLDVEAVGARMRPRLEALKADPQLCDAECVLEMGRWLVGPAGFYLVSVIGEKRSRGTEIRLCDGGMNHHLGACGLLGQVIRRNYPMWNVSAPADRPEQELTLVGPLCTTIDTLATKLRMPDLRRGDLVAVGSSGAYGPTSSPSGFISHPPAREVWVEGAGRDARIEDVSPR
jgi:diaminopimelate decarboxylase